MVDIQVDGDSLSHARLAELLELADQAGKHALTGAYEPIARAARAASDDFEPAVRR